MTRIQRPHLDSLRNLRHGDNLLRRVVTNTVRQTFPDRFRGLSRLRDTRGYMKIADEQENGRQGASIERMPIYEDRSRRSSVSSAMSCSSRRNCWRQWLEMYPMSSFAPGTVIYAFHYEEMADTSPRLDGQTITAVANSPEMISKIRLMIVVARHAKHYVVVPLYTHNGNGLEFKSNKDEYVTVYDSRRTDDTSTAAQSKHVPLVAMMNSSSKMLSDLSSVHITYPVSRSYNLPCAIKGRLNKSSTQRLVNLYNAYAPSFAWEGPPPVTPSLTGSLPATSKSTASMVDTPMLDVPRLSKPLPPKPAHLAPTSDPRPYTAQNPINPIHARFANLKMVAWPCPTEPLAY